jgi:hypothetical protein
MLEARDEPLGQVCDAQAEVLGEALPGGSRGCSEHMVPVYGRVRAIFLVG